MPYDSKADLVIRLAEIRLDIAKARKAQSAGIGGDTITRANLNALLREEQWCLSQIQAVDAQAAGGSGNKVEFARPS